MDKDNQYGNLQMQEYLLPILDDIDQVCRKHNITYSLIFGTLLGAVRHKGFIPWDDDIDIALDRSNFQKLLSVFENEMGNQYCIINDIWVRRISKIDNPGKELRPPQGCVDLFVFDKVSNKQWKYSVQVLLLKILQGMIKTNIDYNYYNGPYKIAIFVTHSLGKLFDKELKQSWYDLISQWGNKDDECNVTCFNAPYRLLTKKYPVDLLKDSINLEFEGREYLSIRKWDEYLTISYGDYMRIPKENDRKSNHLH